MTLPKTTCLLFKKGVGSVVMKNWEPLVLGPEFYREGKGVSDRGGGGVEEIGKGTGEGGGGGVE